MTQNNKSNSTVELSLCYWYLPIVTIFQLLPLLGAGIGGAGIVGFLTYIDVKRDNVTLIDSIVQYKSVDYFLILLSIFSLFFLYKILRGICFKLTIENDSIFINPVFGGKRTYKLQDIESVTISFEAMPSVHVSFSKSCKIQFSDNRKITIIEDFYLTQITELYEYFEQNLPEEKIIRGRRKIRIGNIKF